MAIDNNGTAEFNNVTVRGTVDGSEIKGGSININDNFTVDEKGVLTAKNGEFQRTAKATDGSFINCSINNCTIGENVNFYGNIHSGPLYLTNETPSGSTHVYSSSSYLEDLYSYVQNTLISNKYTYTGIIDGKDFDIINVYHFKKYTSDDIVL